MPQVTKQEVLRFIEQSENSPTVHEIKQGLRTAGLSEDWGDDYASTIDCHLQELVTEGTVKPFGLSEVDADPTLRVRTRSSAYVYYVTAARIRSGGYELAVETAHQRAIEELKRRHAKEFGTLLDKFRHEALESLREKHTEEDKPGNDPMSKAEFLHMRRQLTPARRRMLIKAPPFTTIPGSVASKTSQNALVELGLVEGSKLTPKGRQVRAALLVEPSSLGSFIVHRLTEAGYPWAELTDPDDTSCFRVSAKKNQGIAHVTSAASPRDLTRLLNAAQTLREAGCPVVEVPGTSEPYLIVCHDTAVADRLVASGQLTKTSTGTYLLAAFDDRPGTEQRKQE